MKTHTLTEGGEQPFPWSKNEYGSVVDALGNRVVLDGFSLSCGGGPHDQPRANRDAILSAVAQAAHHSAQLEKALGRVAQLEAVLGEVLTHFEARGSSFCKGILSVESFNKANAILKDEAK